MWRTVPTRWVEEAEARHMALFEAEAIPLPAKASDDPRPAASWLRFLRLACFGLCRPAQIY